MTTDKPFSPMPLELNQFIAKLSSTVRICSRLSVQTHYATWLLPDFTLPSRYYFMQK